MKHSKFLTTFLLMVVLVCSTSTIAFAGGGPSNEEIPIVAVPEQKKEPTPPLTPEGNLTLVDDVTTNDESEKQFITAVSKSGNYFYLVIDRQDDKDNVYLLNMVDEADLVALMEGEPVPMPKPKETQPTPTEPTVEEPIKEEKEKPKSNTLPLLTLVLVMCGGGAFYYLKFVKGKKDNTGSTSVNDMEDEDEEDDDEYEMDEDDQNMLSNDKH